MQLGACKFRAGQYLIKGAITREGQRLTIDFPYNQQVKDEVKSMEGSRFLGYDEFNPRKVWQVADSVRNRFRLSYLQGENVYAPYNTKIEPVQTRRPECYRHQRLLVSHFLTRRQCIAASEMGTGKTLAALEAMEQSGKQDWVWVGPKSALYSVQREFGKWDARIWPRFMTYEALIKLVETWTAGEPAPQGIVFDESSRVKNYTAQRSKAARAIADSMREEYGREAYIWLMSGSPAPKSPVDWWNQCEIACPGFLREGTVEKFKRRLGLILQKEIGDGGSYPQLITWYDDENKCKRCGQLADHTDHDAEFMVEGFYHSFEKSVNEIALLYKRMAGLVEVFFKKDCLDLPEKQYRLWECKPSAEILRAAELVDASSTSAIQALTLRRELSDGFQYTEVENGEEICPMCLGSKEMDEIFDAADPDTMLTLEEQTEGRRAVFGEDGLFERFQDQPFEKSTRKIDCIRCGKKGLIPTYIRKTAEVACPKEEALADLLDLYEDEGRVVIWAGFTASIERCVRLVLKKDWLVIRIDGRGWWSTIPGSPIEMLAAFDNKILYPKIAVVGQPGSGGMGLNLTASSNEIYYSNTFNGEDRTQSEDRIHRPGADHNRGCTIWDIVHLPSDLYVLQNLSKKRNLQNMSMGMLAHELKAASLLARAS